MKNALYAVAVAFSLLAPMQARAELDLRSMVREYQLKNGMKWLLVERHQAPVFTGYVRVRVGGSDEEPGYTGLAHLFEHMAFKGTPVMGTSDFEAEKKLLDQIAVTGDALSVLIRQGKGKSDEAKALQTQLTGLSDAAHKLTDNNALATLYQLNGGTGLNATTDKDLTSYFVSLPRNRLQMWMTVEASRLVSPVLRDFYTERDVVAEERQMRVEASPGGALYEELNQVAFTMSPYRWPTLGYSEDLAAMTLDRAQAFHQRYYVPGNAVGCLVGDFQYDEVTAMLEKTFGSIPAGPKPPEPTFAEPPNRVARRSTVLFDANPEVMIAFRKPAPPAREDYVFDVLQVLLGEGRTGRLSKRLVLKDRIAESIGSFGAPGARLENLFVIAVTPLAGVSTATLEKAIWSELDRLKTEKVPEAELQKVRNRVAADHARSLETNSGLAGSLSYAQEVMGDWRYVADQPKVIESITAEEVRQVASTFFRPERSVLVELAKPNSPTSATAPGKPPPGAKAKGGGAR